MKMKLRDVPNSPLVMQALAAGANTEIVDVLTYPVYSTVKLATGVDTYAPFSIPKSAVGVSVSDTNVQQGNRVASKQSWQIHGLNIYVLGTDVPLNDAGLQALNKTIFKSVMTLQVDDSPKFELPLSTILGASMMAQSAAAVGANSMNSLFAGSFPLDEEILLSAETQFEFKITDYETGAVPVILNNTEIRIELDRTLYRLV